MDYELMMNGNVKIGERAPAFDGIEKYKGKWLVIFSYKGAFDMLSTKEIIEFSRAYKYFQKINVELIGISIDSNDSNIAWLNDIYYRIGIKVQFPLISDRSGVIARQYGMISPEISKIETTRNVYIIDDKGIVKCILSYPLEVERSIPEILRVIKVLKNS